MKKLILGCALAMLGIVANAASINWATSNDGLLNPDGSAAGGEGYITMYLWSITSDTFNTLSGGGASAVSAKVWANYKDNLGSAESSYADDGMGQIMLTSTSSYASGDTAYAAVILTYDEGSGVTHYKGNIGQYTFDADADITVAGMDSVVFGDISGTSALGWSAVPEPTSGLLMLLGVAGLALRRKHA